MTRLKAILVALALGIAIAGITAVLPGEAQSQPPSISQGDKYDGDCTVQEAAGRCADKCPPDTSEGTYHLQGYDKDTGAAVCRLEYYHACPYADSQPANGPVCEKLEAQQRRNPPVAPVKAPPIPAGFRGK